MVVYGQVVVGAPGAGKTTYCAGMAEYLRCLGRRAAVVNLDPANERLPYTAAIDLGELVDLPTVMHELSLGPNGGLLYCMEFLEKNMDWLFERLAELEERYIIFDFPGQVELFTHCGCVAALVAEMQRRDFRVTAVNLIDAHHCADASKFIAASVLSLSVMLRLELPHVNVLSKVDLTEQYGALPFNLEFFTDMQDLSRLLPYLDARPMVTPFCRAVLHLKRMVRFSLTTGPKSPRNAETSRSSDAERPQETRDPGEEAQDHVSATTAGVSDDQDEEDAPNATEVTRLDQGMGDLQHQAHLRRRRRLHEALCELVDEFSLVSYETLNIQDAGSVGRLLAKVDKANGYVFCAAESPANAHASYASDLFRVVARETEMNAERTLLVQEKYFGRQGAVIDGVPDDEGESSGGEPGKENGS